MTRVQCWLHAQVYVIVFVPYRWQSRNQIISIQLAQDAVNKAMDHQKHGVTTQMLVLACNMCCCAANLSCFGCPARHAHSCLHRMSMEAPGDRASFLRTVHTYSKDQRFPCHADGGNGRCCAPFQTSPAKTSAVCSHAGGATVPSNS
jgi:hypothetical protein